MAVYKGTIPYKGPVIRVDKKFIRSTNNGLH